jgi:hypothetical protein
VWTAADPSLFDGRSSNLYTYASNDPVNRADPTGHVAIADDLAFTLPVLGAGATAAAVGLTGAAIDGWFIGDALNDAFGDSIQSALDDLFGPANPGLSGPQICESRGKGERGQTRPGGNDNPWKKTRPHPTDPTKILEKDNQDGKWK